MGGCPELSAVQFPVPHHRGDTFNRGAEQSPECAVRQFQHLGRPRPHRQVGTDQDSVQSSVSRCVREGFNGLLDDRLERVHPFGSGLSAVQPGRHETCAEQRVVPQPVRPGVVLQRLPARSCRRPGRSPFRSRPAPLGRRRKRPRQVAPELFDALSSTPPPAPEIGSAARCGPNNSWPAGPRCQRPKHSGIRGQPQSLRRDWIQSVSELNARFGCCIVSNIAHASANCCCVSRNRERVRRWSSCRCCLA